MKIKYVQGINSNKILDTSVTKKNNEYKYYYV